MTMTWTLWVVIGVVVVAGFGILGFLGTCRLLDHWAKQEDQATRERLSRILSANAPPEWPRTKGPHGFERGGRS